MSLEYVWRVRLLYNSCHTQNREEFYYEKAITFILNLIFLSDMLSDYQNFDQNIE